MSDSASSMTPQDVPGAAKKAEVEKPITFAYNDSQLTINLPKPKKEEIEAAKEDAAKDIPAPEEGPQAEQMQAMAMQMMKDMKMSCKIVVEPGIEETNATHHEGNTITLMEMEMGKLMANPEIQKQLKGLDMQDPAAFEEKLKGIEGVKGESKEKVTVKVK